MHEHKLNFPLGRGHEEAPFIHKRQVPKSSHRPFFEPLTTVARDVPTPALPQRGRESMPGALDA